MNKRLPKGTVMIRGNDRNLRAVRVRYEEQKTRSPRGARRPQRIETEDLGVVHHSSLEAERLLLK